MALSFKFHVCINYKCCCCYINLTSLLKILPFLLIYFRIKRVINRKISQPYILEYFKSITAPYLTRPRYNAKVFVVFICYNVSENVTPVTF